MYQLELHDVQAVLVDRDENDIWVRTPSGRMLTVQVKTATAPHAYGTEKTPIYRFYSQKLGGFDRHLRSGGATAGGCGILHAGRDASPLERERFHEGADGGLDQGAVGMKPWSERSLKSLAGIHPDLRKIMDRAREMTDIDFVVIEGLRTKERQAELVKKGASKTMKSRHLTGHAVDLVPLLDLDGNGKIETQEMFNWPLMKRLAVIIKMAAKDVHVPIEWGGDWTTFPDGPHYQLPPKVYP